MADENEIVEGNAPEQTPEAPELSPIEQKAAEQGWVPKDQWTGDPDDWRPAKEFVDRGELFKKIDEVRRENKRLREGHEELVKHHLNVRKLAYEQALADLKEQKKAALAEGDVDAVVEIDERIAETKEEQRTAKAEAVQEAAQPDPVFESWINRNQWYTTDVAAKAVADEVARMLFMRGERDKEALLEAAEKAVRKEFPHKFNNPKRDQAGAVEGSTGKKVTKSAPDADLSDAERQIMNKVLRVTPGLTKEQYIKELKAVKSRFGE
jgi:hypothetical protein